MTRPIVVMTPVQAIPSPCTNVCSIDPADGYCEGCRRTLDEIARWTTMPATERDTLMATLPDR